MQCDDVMYKTMIRKYVVEYVVEYVRESASWQAVCSTVSKASDVRLSRTQLSYYSFYMMVLVVVRYNVQST